MDKKLLSLKEAEVTSSDVFLASILLMFDSFSAKGTSEAAFKNNSSQDVFKNLQGNYFIMIIFL